MASKAPVSQTRLVTIDPEALGHALRECVERAAVSVVPSDVQSPPHEPWLSIADAANYAAVSEDTVREWIRLELLPCGRAGRVIRVRRSAIDVLLLSGASGPTSGTIECENDRALEIVRELQGKGDG
jgi:excisionase family DNA binding protein